MSTYAAVQARETCSKGHAYTPENVRLQPDGTRRCLTCRREWDRVRSAQRRAIAKVDPTRARPQRKFPAEPLLAIAARNGITIDDRKALERIKGDGLLSERVADRLACKVLKLHPALVWGDAWWGEDVAS